MHRVALTACLTVALATQVGAQSLPVGDPFEDYGRLLSLTGLTPSQSFLIRPLNRPPLSGGPWQVVAPESSGLTLHPVQLRLFGNSAFAAGTNDGAVWQGRGVTLSLDGGASWRRGGLTVTLRPQLIWTQNSSFALRAVESPGRTEFANPWHPRRSSGAYVDQPQRFGPEGFWTFDLGQSAIRYDVGWFAASGGTENLWWGPGRQNAIVLSHNAAGVPHAWIGTGRPVDVGIGTIEAQWMWGRLTGTKWSDSVVADTARFLTGLIGVFAPQPFPTLYLGAARMFYESIPADGLPFSDWFLVFQGVTKETQADSANPTGDDRRDQLLSLFARWALPSAGAEFYVEWARNDHSWDLRDLALEPEHSQAYTLGFQVARPVGEGRLLRVEGELTHLERSATAQVRATPTYYVHHLIRQGYTQRGQVLGAGIGPGSNSQQLGADLFARWGRVGGFVSRVVHDNDAYYAYTGDTISYGQHHVTLAFGARGLVFWRDLELGGTLELARDLNRYFVLENDVTNVRTELYARWRPRRGSRRRRRLERVHG